MMGSQPYCMHGRAYINAGITRRVARPSQLCAIAEVYTSADGKCNFVDDFVATWSKVMHLGFTDGE